MTKTKGDISEAGWVLYDGECPLCVGWAGRFTGTLQRAGFSLATLQSRSGTRDFSEMVVLTPAGGAFGGADGLVQIARRVWWAWPLFALAQIPGAIRVLRRGYRRLAANRHCLGGACRVAPRNSSEQMRQTRTLSDTRFSLSNDPRDGMLAGDVPKPPVQKPALRGSLLDASVRLLPLICLPVAAFLLRDAVPAWVFMWSMAFALFAGCKWLTFATALRTDSATSAGRASGYLLGWPGMDAAGFLNADVPIATPRAAEWLPGLVTALLGATLFWSIARLFIETHPLLAGWIGMTGVVLMLHFGLFHLLALAWRTAGVNATPVMRNPIRAVSLGEFWGRRWNTAFHELVHRYTFRPLLRKTGAICTLFLVFLLSGLVHELVISVPARGGYGLPTGYFLIQGLGVVIERTALGKRLGLGHGVAGWSFTMFLAAAPAYWLFPPSFQQNVILPMLHALGAT